MSYLKLITAPTEEPVTIDDVKLHTRIDHATEDSLLSIWISSGRKLAEDYQRRAYLSQTWEMSFDTWPTLPALFSRGPIISVDSFKYYDYLDTETTYALTNFTLDYDSDPGRIDLAYSVTWPAVTLRSINSVKIRFTCGYGSNASDVPATVKDAIMLYVAYRNENRVAESGSAPVQFYDILRPDRLYTV
jgi:uncharacterized phiE125 gp8 family phage protein